MIHLAILLALAQVPAPMSKDYYMKGDLAYRLMPAEVVSPGQTANLVWSPSGSYLLYCRTAIPTSTTTIPPAGTMLDYLIYDPAAKRSVKAISIDAAKFVPSEIKWIPQGDGLLFTFMDRVVGDEQLYFVSAKGTSKLLAKGDRIAVAVSDTAPLAAFMIGVEHGKPGAMTFIDGAGTTSAKINLDPSPQQFELVGTDLYLLTYQATDDGPVVSRHLYDRQTGQRRDAPKFDQEPVPGKSLPIDAFVGPLPFAAGANSGDFKFVWIMARPKPEDDTRDQQIAVVTTDGTEAAMSPRLDAVAYVSQGITMIRRMNKVDPKEVLLARDAQARKEALERAKQVGLAILMFAGDNEDRYPPNKGWQDAIAPYLRNSKVGDGFNYTFGGGDATRIENPATMELGFFDCPGGRAVVYADGHAKFVPTNPA